MNAITRRIGVIAVSGMLGAFGFVSAAQAAPGDNGNGVGGCVDDFNGNATNPRPSGNGVLPSQSPGPFVNTGANEPPRNDRVRGASIGDVQQFFREIGLNGKEAQDVSCPR